MAEENLQSPGGETGQETRGTSASSGSLLQWLRLAVGFVVCFWFWAKWLYSPPLVYLPPLPPVEVPISMVQRALGPWLMALVPLLALGLVIFDGLTLRRAAPTRWWTKHLVRGSLLTVLVHTAVWVAGSLLFYAAFAILPGSQVLGKPLSDPVVQGLMLFAAFLSLIMTGPVTALVMVLDSLRVRRRRNFPATHVATLNFTAAVLLVPLLGFWIVSGDAAALARSLRHGKSLDPASATALFQAVRDGDAETARVLLRDGAPADSRDSSGTAVLMAAAGDGYTAIVRTLIDAAADVNAKNDSGRTALMSAVGGRHLEVVQVLLSAHANVNAQDADGKTALMIAASAGDAGITRALLQAGADVNGASATGNTALMFAARGGHAEIAKLLVAAGADVNAQDKNGASVLAMAAKLNRAEIVRILRAAGAKE